MNFLRFADTIVKRTNDISVRTTVMYFSYYCIFFLVPVYVYQIIRDRATKDLHA
jgi:hypothetical protein